VPIPSADAFAALARSSPWRWTTLRFTFRARRGRTWSEPERAWLRRPDRLRVESTDGELRRTVHEPRRTVAVLSLPPAGDDRTRTLPWPRDGHAPQLRADGLVAVRPRGLGYDDPMHDDYRWVAMLDPVELADGWDTGTGAPAPALVIGPVTEVEHAGRPAWEAVVVPTAAYEPRCGCCPLLRDARVDGDEWGSDRFAFGEYPSGSLVRLDVGTGVCVWTEALDGTWAGEGHDLRIEAVDEPMADELFRRGPGQ